MEVATERTTRPVSELRPNSLNPRGDVSSNHVEELVASIKAQGVLQPLLVTPDGTVVAGHRRLAAAKVAGLDRVPVVERDLGAPEQLEIMLIENLQREDLTPLEEARAYQRLRDMGVPQAEIARRVGLSSAHVSDRLLILRLDPTVQEMVARLDLPLTLVRPLSKVGDWAKQRRLAAMSANRRLTVKQLDEIIRRGEGVLGEGKKAAAAPAPKRNTAEPKGATRKLALDLLRGRAGASVSCKAMAEAMDATCGVCGSCGMSTIEAVCRECPLPQFVARVAG